jgi:hypothetical protein
MMIACIVIISLSEGEITEKETNEVDAASNFSWKRFWAIVFAVLTGVAFSANSIDLHYGLTTTKLSAYQMNADGYFLMGLCMVPFYLYAVYVNSETYTTYQFFWANANNLFVYLASVTMNLALLYGMGGIVQAIENLKTVW